MRINAASMPCAERHGVQREILAVKRRRRAGSQRVKRREGVQEGTTAEGAVEEQARGGNGKGSDWRSDHRAAYISWHPRGCISGNIVGTALRAEHSRRIA